MKHLIRALLVCCRDAPSDVQEAESPHKPQTEPAELPLREESPPLEEEAAVSQPAGLQANGSDEEQPAEEAKPVEVSAEESLMPEVPPQPKKKREKKSRKREQPSKPIKKKPNFKSGSMSARDGQKEGLHKPLPPSAKPKKSILKKR